MAWLFSNSSISKSNGDVLKVFAGVLRDHARGVTSGPCPLRLSTNSRLFVDTYIYMPGHSSSMLQMTARSSTACSGLPLGRYGLALLPYEWWNEALYGVARTVYISTTVQNQVPTKLRRIRYEVVRLETNIVASMSFK